jgi:pyruvate ferredoxin oxidoreductase gamma subunit
MKTASRVVGTAALLDGLEAQDSPVYGAERRGAPMAAFVRLDREAIRERGPIPVPELVVVADDTLLDDVGVQPLAGLPPTGALLLATAHSLDEVRRHTGHRGPIVARDFLTLALAEVGSVAGLSTALSAAACALLGLSERATDDALRVELEAIELSPERIDASLRLGRLARAGLAPLAPPAPGGTVPRPGSPVVDVTYARPETGAPTVIAPANTPLRKPGSWRVFRPVIDLARCTRCWICFVRCPEGAIALDADDTPRVDYDVCKGCLICVEECPTHTIAAVREAREWAAAEAAP